MQLGNAATDFTHKVRDILSTINANVHSSSSVSSSSLKVKLASTSSSYPSSHHDIASSIAQFPTLVSLRAHPLNRLHATLSAIPPSPRQRSTTQSESTASTVDPTLPQSFLNGNAAQTVDAVDSVMSLFSLVRFLKLGVGIF
jgi:hypothetical protein